MFPDRTLLFGLNPLSPGTPMVRRLQVGNPMERRVGAAERRTPAWVDPRLRRRFWNRLCRLGILRERELVRVHRVAQEQRIAPEQAVVALGLLTRDQAAEFLVGERPFGFSMEALGIA